MTRPGENEINLSIRIELQKHSMGERMTLAEDFTISEPMNFLEAAKILGDLHDFFAALNGRRKG